MYDNNLSPRAMATFTCIQGTRYGGEDARFYDGVIYMINTNGQTIYS